jgi:hypothetical protein
VKKKLNLHISRRSIATAGKAISRQINACFYAMFWRTRTKRANETGGTLAALLKSPAQRANRRPLGRAQACALVRGAKFKVGDVVLNHSTKSFPQTHTQAAVITDVAPRTKHSGIRYRLNHDLTGTGTVPSTWEYQHDILHNVTSTFLTRPDKRASYMAMTPPATHPHAQQVGIMSDVMDSEKHMSLRTTVLWGETATLEEIADVVTWKEVLGVAKAAAIESVSNSATTSSDKVGRKVRKLFATRARGQKHTRPDAGIITCRPDSCDWQKVVYADGDSEDMDAGEIGQHLYKQRCSVMRATLKFPTRPRPSAQR